VTVSGRDNFEKADRFCLWDDPRSSLYCVIEGNKYIVCFVKEKIIFGDNEYVLKGDE
jgi:hypothetical protein